MSSIGVQNGGPNGGCQTGVPRRGVRNKNVTLGVKQRCRRRESNVGAKKRVSNGVPNKDLRMSTIVSNKGV